MENKFHTPGSLGKLTVATRLIDVFLIAAAGHVSGEFRFPQGMMGADVIHPFLTLFCALCAFSFFPYFQLYKSWRGRGILTMCVQTVSAWLVIWLLGVLVAFFLHQSGAISRLWAVTWLLSTSGALVAIRVLVYYCLRFLRGHGFNRKTVFIVGYGSHGQELHLKVKRKPSVGFDVVGHLPGHQGSVSADIPAVEHVDHIADFVTTKRVDEVWVTLPLSAHEEIEAILTHLRGLPVEIRWMLDAPTGQFITYQSGDVLGSPSIDLNHLPQPGVRGLLKNAFDRLSAAILLLLLSPVMGAIALAIRFSSPGPVLYGHTRIGANARRFKVYKFRSMVTNSQEILEELLRKDPVARAEWEADQKLRNDPRITRIGQFLRVSSLDELPQLFNVLRGEMSLVGPRPIVDAEVKKYGAAIQYYYSARPGITGLWQVSGRNDVSYDSRVKLDCRYVLHWSLWEDLKILFKTVGVVFRGSGAY